MEVQRSIETYEKQSSDAAQKSFPGVTDHPAVEGTERQPNLGNREYQLSEVDHPEAIDGQHQSSITASKFPSIPEEGSAADLADKQQEDEDIAQARILLPTSNYRPSRRASVSASFCNLAASLANTSELVCTLFKALDGRFRGHVLTYHHHHFY